MFVRYEDDISVLNCIPKSYNNVTYVCMNILHGNKRNQQKEYSEKSNQFVGQGLFFSSYKGTLLQRQQKIHARSNKEEDEVINIIFLYLSLRLLRILIS